MALNKRRQLTRLLQEIENAEHAWLNERGLASLLPYLGDVDDNTACLDSSRGLASLLDYEPPRIERSDGCVA